MDNITKKIKRLRKAENLTQKGFSELIDIPTSTLKTIESGQQSTINSSVLIKIINNPRLKKYAMWLTAEDEPQISDDKALNATTDEILEAIDDLPADIKLQAETMAKMLLLEQKTNLIHELSRQVDELKS